MTFLSNMFFKGCDKYFYGQEKAAPKGTTFFYSKQIDCDRVLECEATQFQSSWWLPRSMTSSIFKDNNLVCIEDSLQTMGNDETSSACYNRLHGMLNLAFCHSIYVRSGFISRMRTSGSVIKVRAIENQLLLSCREDALVIIYRGYRTLSGKLSM